MNRTYHSKSTKEPPVPMPKSGKSENTIGTFQFADNRSKSNREKLLSAVANGSEKKSNGLPENLKSGIESLSGFAMDDVSVHYNSSKPAQLNAHAYAQGNNIHLAPGQDKHLPHEAWHVVQQKQGRVKPTIQTKDKVNINDDKNLEKEADIMGMRSLNSGNSKTDPGWSDGMTASSAFNNTKTNSGPIQMVHPTIEFEWAITKAAALITKTKTARANRKQHFYEKATTALAQAGTNYRGLDNSLHVKTLRARLKRLSNRFTAWATRNGFRQDTSRLDQIMDNLGDGVKEDWEYERDIDTMYDQSANVL